MNNSITLNHSLRYDYYLINPNMEPGCKAGNLKDKEHFLNHS